MLSAGAAVGVALLAGVTDVGFGLVVPTYLAARRFLLADLIAVILGVAGTWFIVMASTLLRTGRYPRTDAHGSLAAGAIFSAVAWAMLAIRVIGLILVAN